MQNELASHLLRYFNGIRHSGVPSGKSGTDWSAQRHIKSNTPKVWPCENKKHMTSGYTCIFEHTETHSLCWLKQDEPSKKVNLSHTLNANPADVMETADLSRYSALVVVSVKASLHLHRFREEHRRKLDGG